MDQSSSMANEINIANFIKTANVIDENFKIFEKKLESMEQKLENILNVIKEFGDAT